MLWAKDWTWTCCWTYSCLFGNCLYDYFCICSKNCKMRGVRS